MTSQIQPEKTADGDFAHPDQECDLVMKGGITSGVVYPAAILKLAEKYRFRSIGGTSAGAIAAAAVAAAEFGREQGGYEKLKGLQGQLGEEGFILKLFQPSKVAAPIFNTLLGLMGNLPPKEGKASKRAFGWLKLGGAVHTGLWRNNPKAVIAGTLAGASLPFAWAGLVGGSLKGKRLIIPLVTGWLGFLSGGVGNLARLLIFEVPKDENLFGMCPGHSDENLPEGKQPLTDFLTEKLDELAGLDELPEAEQRPGRQKGEPLTFADLSAKKIDFKTGTSKDPAIVFQLVTTNLSQGQPYILPRAEMNLIFKAEEMSKLFPRRVVDYMVRVGEQERLKLKDEKGVDISLPEGFHFFPPGNLLPVVVGTRMSLSYPLLLCAVPLYTISHAWYQSLVKEKQLDLRGNPGGLQRNWFSDGGMCSNFPIHLFDSWLPSRPTFGINLASIPKISKKLARSDVPVLQRSIEQLVVTEEYASNLLTAQEDNQNVLLPRPGTPLLPEFREVKGLKGFFSIILSTMQNYRDNAQSSLPSYRERIVQVRLNPGEGGLNLAMTPQTIHEIEKKGIEAAERFLPPPENRKEEAPSGPAYLFDFNEHRWVRLRVLMEQLEERLERLKINFPGVAAYDGLNQTQLAANQAGRPYYCPADQEWWEQARPRLEQLVNLAQSWDTASSGPVFTRKAPIPHPMLRVTPQG